MAARKKQPAEAQASVLTRAESIPLSQIRLSSTAAQRSRREAYDKRGMKRLAASVGRMGVLVPILVRPAPEGSAVLPKDGAKYEVVAGERRFRAAQEAKLDEIPALVRELSDVQALEAQLVENLQREDLDELSEADGYDALMANHDYTAEMIADKIGRSRSYVYGRLKLKRLNNKVRTEIVNGRLPASIGLLIAQVPPELQSAALKVIQTGRWGHGRPMSYREAKRYIAEDFTVSLSSAPFRLEAKYFKAGSCLDCPKRGANIEPFDPEAALDDVDPKGKPRAELTPNTCTDVGCYRAKVGQSVDRKVEAAKKKGLKVVAGPEAVKMLPSPHSPVTGTKGYVRLDGEQWGPDGKPIKLPAKDRPAATLLVVEDRHSKLPSIVEVFSAKDVDAALRAKGGAGLKRRKEPDPHAKQRRDAKRRTAFMHEAYVRVREHHPANVRALTLRHLETLADTLYGGLDGTRRKTMGGLWWPKIDTTIYRQPIGEILGEAPDEAALLAFIVDCAYIGKLTRDPWERPENCVDREEDLLGWISSHPGVDLVDLREKHGQTLTLAEAHAKAAKEAKAGQEPNVADVAVRDGEVLAAMKEGARKRDQAKAAAAADAAVDAEAAT